MGREGTTLVVVQMRLSNETIMESKKDDNFFFNSYYIGAFSPSKKVSKFTVSRFTKFGVFMSILKVLVIYLGSGDLVRLLVITGARLGFISYCNIHRL